MDTLYESECKRAALMERDEILSELERIADADRNVPSLGAIHALMITVEAFADVYYGRDRDRGDLLGPLMRCHERFRDWIGCYS